jgi:hypothetical protein
MSFFGSVAHLWAKPYEWLGHEVSQGAKAVGGALKPTPGSTTSSWGSTPEAQQYYEQLLKGGNLGFSALTGDPNALAQFQNPYQQQVIDANNADWAHTNVQTQNQVNDAATQAGAFGGSRHGVAEGVALSNNNRAQQDQLAQLRSQGYNDAMSRAYQTANLGLSGGVGMGGWQKGTQQGGSNPLSGILGGATAGAPLGPWGVIGGGLLGGLLGGH